MKNRTIYRFAAIILSLASSGPIAKAQKASDTIALVKEFNKVMAFAVQPHLYYATLVKGSASPIIDPQDTLQLNGEFFKNGTNLYYGNEQEETFLEDSLLVQINHSRKSVWISKVDMASKEKVNMLPLDNKDLQKLFAHKYIINKIPLDDDRSLLELRTSEGIEGSGIVMDISIRYADKTKLPAKMDIEINMRQQTDDNMQKEIAGMSPTYAPELLQSKKGEVFLVRKQHISIDFINMDTGKEKAAQMPSWKEKLLYDNAGGAFIGKGVCRDYEITKMF